MHLYIEGRNYGRGTEVTLKCKELTSFDMIFVLTQRNSNTTSLMSSSTYETCLQGVMVSVLIILDCRYFVLMNKSTMIPYRCISQKELAIVKTTEYLGIQSVVVILKFLMFVLLSSLAFNPLLKNRN